MSTNNNNNNTVTLKNKLLMANNLNKLGIDGIEFCNKIRQHDCLMAGSYPLQCLLGESYSDSDIDIFIKSNDDFSEFETWLYEKYAVKSVVTTYVIRDVIRSRKTQITPLGLVNIVIVSTKNLHEYVNDHFDLSFCQTTFDGDTFTYNELSLRKIGYIINHDTININYYNQINNLSGNKSINIQEILDGRIKKYKNRGFIIIPSPLQINKIGKEELLDMVVDQFKQNFKIAEEMKELNQLKDNQLKQNYELEEEVKKLKKLASEQLKHNCEIEEEVKKLEKMKSNQSYLNYELEEEVKKLKSNQLQQNYMVDQEAQKLRKKLKNWKK